MVAALEARGDAHLETGDVLTIGNEIPGMTTTILDPPRLESSSQLSLLIRASAESVSSIGTTFPRTGLKPGMWLYTDGDQSADKCDFPEKRLIHSKTMQVWKMETTVTTALVSKTYNSGANSVVQITAKNETTNDSAMRIPGTDMHFGGYDVMNFINSTYGGYETISQTITWNISVSN